VAVASKLETRFEEELAKQWKVGINPNGGGFFLKSPDDNFRLRLFGYAQAQGTLTDGANGFAFENYDTRSGARGSTGSQISTSATSCSSRSMLPRSVARRWSRHG
jgi:hypothetical protein